MSGSYERVMADRKQLVEQIIENMKAGYVMPKEAWNRGLFKIQNPVSGARYRGSNQIRLCFAAVAKGYTDNRWCTYKQAQEQGWQVKKGAKGVTCEKYIFDKWIKEENPETGEITRKKIELERPMVNTFTVFNEEQIEGIPEQPALEPLQEDEITEMVDRFRESSVCPIKETNEGRAYYSPVRDEIHLPLRDAFLDSQSLLATQLHEMVHSTGHSSRLNRPILNQFGTEKYALEELRAELGAYFLQADLGLSFDTQHFNSHTMYLESWIGALQNDTNELFRAIADAQKASDYLISRYELALKQTEEQILSKQEAAAVRMAVKHEIKEADTGIDHLEKWISKDMKRQEALQLPEKQYEPLRDVYQASLQEARSLQQDAAELLVEAQIQTVSLTR